MILVPFDIFSPYYEGKQKAVQDNWTDIFNNNKNGKEQMDNQFQQATQAGKINAYNGIYDTAADNAGVAKLTVPGRRSDAAFGSEMAISNNIAKTPMIPQMALNNASAWMGASNMAGVNGQTQTAQAQATNPSVLGQLMASLEQANKQTAVTNANTGNVNAGYTNAVTNAEVQAKTPGIQARAANAATLADVSSAGKITEAQSLEAQNQLTIKQNLWAANRVAAVSLMGQPGNATALQAVVAPHLPAGAVVQPGVNGGGYVLRMPGGGIYPLGAYMQSTDESIRRAAESKTEPKAAPAEADPTARLGLVNQIPR